MNRDEIRKLIDIWEAAARVFRLVGDLSIAAAYEDCSNDLKELLKNERD